MAKDITLKNADGSVIYYPKTVSDLVYDNETGKTVKEQIENLPVEIGTETLEEHLLYDIRTLEVPNTYATLNAQIGSLFDGSLKGSGTDWFGVKYAVKKGDKVILEHKRMSGNNNGSTILITNSSDIVVYKESFSTIGYYDFTYDITDNGYIYVNAQTTHDTKIKVYTKVDIKKAVEDINAAKTDINAVKTDISELKETVEQNTNNINSVKDIVMFDSSRTLYYDDLKNNPDLDGECFNTVTAKVGSLRPSAKTTNASFFANKIEVHANEKITITKYWCASLTGQASRFLITDTDDIVRDIIMCTVANAYENIPTFTVAQDGYLYINLHKSHVGTVIEIEGSATNIKDEVDIIKADTENLNTRVEALEEGKTDSKASFVLPKYIDVPVGMESPIFIESLHTEPEFATDGLISMTANNEVLAFDKFIKWTPTTAKNITANFYRHNNNMDVMYQGSTILRSFNKTGATKNTWNILVSGSSNIDGTKQPCELFRLLRADGDITVNDIGTRTASYDYVVYNHEGRGSWTWDAYLNPLYENTPFSNKTNAFMIDGHLNFKAYMQKYFPSLSGIDIFVMNLGTNDVTQGTSLVSDEKISQIINSAKNFINAVLLDYPNCKFIVGLPTIGAPSQPALDRRHQIYKNSIQRLNKAYIDAFDNSKFKKNVIVCPFTIFMNREQLFKHEDVVIDSVYANSSNNDSVIDTTCKLSRRYTDMIHCLDNGYRNWGSGLYRTVRAVINGLYD